jgi:hypothetical protein
VGLQYHWIKVMWKIRLIFCIFWCIFQNCNSSTSSKTGCIIQICQQWQCGCTQNTVTKELCISVSAHLVPTGSLWRHQSQQGFNMLTPFYFLSHSLQVLAPTGHPQVRYTIKYLKDYFNTTDPLQVRNLMQRCYMLYISTSTCSPNTCYQI